MQFKFLCRFSHYGLLLIAAFVFSFILASCSSNGTENTALENTPAENTSDEPCEAIKSQATNSQKIVSLSPTATEMVFAIGAGEQVVAVDEFSTYPESAPRISGLSGFTPNIESILSYEPNLVLVSSSRTDDEFAKLEDNFGICLFRLSAPADLDGVYSQIELLGEITSKEEEAGQLVQEMKSDTANATAKVSPQTPRQLRYFYELDNTFYTVTDNTFIGYVLGLLGLESIAPAKTQAGEYPQMSEEAVLSENPDIIFLADVKCCGQTAEVVSRRAGWDELEAVKQGKILELDEDIASRWGPRIVDLLAEVANFVSANFPAHSS